MVVDFRLDAGEGRPGIDATKNVGMVDSEMGEFVDP
jgi:hypothetical protein